MKDEKKSVAKGLMARAEQINETLEQKQKKSSFDADMTTDDEDLFPEIKINYSTPEKSKPYDLKHDEKSVNEKEDSGLQETKNYQKKHERKQNSLFSRILTKIIIILILLCSLVAGGLFYLKIITTPVEPEKKSIVIQDQLAYCQEFVSLKYKYSDIVSIKKNAKIGPSKSYSIVKYSGIIRVGIADMTECDYEVSEDEKTVKIKLPDAEILGNDIVSQEVFDEQHSIFVPITLDEVFTEIEKSREDALEDIKAEGIVEEAREYAKKIVRQILLSAGYEDVIVL